MILLKIINIINHQVSYTYNCKKYILSSGNIYFFLYETVRVKMVPQGGLEPPTQRFSVFCSTN